MTVAHAQEASTGTAAAPLPGVRPPSPDAVEVAQAPYTGTMPETTGTVPPEQPVNAP